VLAVLGVVRLTDELGSLKELDGGPQTGDPNSQSTSGVAVLGNQFPSVSGSLVLSG